MGVLGLLLVAVAAEPDEGLAKKMLPIYQKEAEGYSIAVESAPKKALELKKEPVFEWLNPARNTQQGAIFLWLRDGRPAALGCFFSAPRPQWNGRMVMHELHALDPEKLLVKRDSVNAWKPEAGLARRELDDAPAPAATPAARLIQMRKLAQEFSGHSIDRDMKRWELRLLPTPMYRYPVAKAEPAPAGGPCPVPVAPAQARPSAPGEAHKQTGVIDGALFALMSSAGTDPEVLLVIEAREVEGKIRWEFACGRFSDWELRIQRKDKEVWSSVPGPTNPFQHDPQHLYRIYPEKIVNLDGKLLARVKQTPKGQEVTPVEDK